MKNPRYFIEFRFHGYAKKYLKGLADQISDEFEVFGAFDDKYVPHMTLIPPFETDEEFKMVETVKNVCDDSNYDKIFTISSVDKMVYDGRDIIAANITAHDQLKDLRKKLHDSLENIIDCVSPNKPKDKFKFHVTLAINDINHCSDKIKELINADFNPIEQYLLRVSIIKNKTILYEYDFPRRKILSREKSLDRRTFYGTYKMLQGEMRIRATKKGFQPL